MVSDDSNSLIAHLRLQLEGSRIARRSAELQIQIIASRVERLEALAQTLDADATMIRAHESESETPLADTSADVYGRFAEPLIEAIQRLSTVISENDLESDLSRVAQEIEELEGLLRANSAHLVLDMGKVQETLSDHAAQFAAAAAELIDGGEVLRNAIPEWMGERLTNLEQSSDEVSARLTECLSAFSDATNQLSEAAAGLMVDDAHSHLSALSSQLMDGLGQFEKLALDDVRKIAASLEQVLGTLRQLLAMIEPIKPVLRLASSLS